MRPDAFASNASPNATWQPTCRERLDFWRDCYALSAFRDVHDYIPRWERRDPEDVGFRRALEVAILVSYARPFKQRKRVRLEKEIVPARFRETHEEVIELRDKVIAHRDTDGPSSGGWDFINDLIIGKEKEWHVTIQTNTPGMSDESMTSLKRLVDHLIPIMEHRTAAFRMRLYPLLGDGWFKISLAESPVAWLQPDEP
jgi:hypothetical protein